MGDLNLSQYQTRVLLLNNNLPSTDPNVTAGLHTQAINDAANDLVRDYPDLFPEHGANRTVTQGPTIVGDNAIAIPDTLVTVHRVTHSNGTTITSGDWSSVEEKFVGPISAETIGLLNKDSDVTGYPQQWDRKANQIYYYPTTRTGYTTYFRLYGTSNETRLSASGDTFRLHRDYDECVVLYAASKLALILGETARHAELEASYKRIVDNGLRVLARERAKKGIMFTAAMCPK
jgi:hypothetical protein